MKPSSSGLESLLFSFFCPQAEFECINSKKKQKKKGYKNSGVVSVKSCQVGVFPFVSCRPNFHINRPTSVQACACCF